MALTLTQTLKTQKSRSITLKPPQQNKNNNAENPRRNTGCIRCDILCQELHHRLAKATVIYHTFSVLSRSGAV